LPLRTHILRSLSSLPGTRELQLVVLVTAPRRHAGLFPYARPRVRGWVQDVLLLVFERSAELDLSTPELQQQKQEGTACIAALEASLYLFPSTTSSILYIAKLDTSGLSSPPSPSAILARAFLSHLCAPSTRPTPVVWVHVFARAQGQYLFPNSSENGRKRVLGDARLCGWWKSLLQEVVREVLPEPGVTTGTAVHTAASNKSYAAFYLLPGYSALEATRLLPARPTPPIPWTYAHPYTLSPSPSSPSSSLPPAHPLPLPWPSAHPTQGIAGLIPSFPDDPKARFVQELASDVDPLAAVPRKRGNLKGPDPPQSGKNKSSQETGTGPGGGAEEKALARTGVDEFWQLVPFRQECSSGAVTAFFVLVFLPPPQAEPADHPGLMDGSAHGPGPSISTSTSTSKTDDLPPLPGQVSQAVLGRVTSALLDLDFGTVERGLRASGVLGELVRVLC
ncbi:hypothetical protein CALVIDRAFT_472700, partial [Calocera viscosa TUFC12733]